MDATMRIERVLGTALGGAKAGPPALAAAMHHGVFPRGARVRPRLCLAVAAACGEDDPALAAATAGAIELLHCASLIHDDLPCFDDAPIRRGRASVPAAFGAPLAVLAGDALIVLAFQLLAEGAARHSARLAALIATVARATGTPMGIAAGQAWECEPEIDLGVYHRAKTGALFTAATVAGALSAGADGEPWHGFGESLGEAYQVADDIGDCLSNGPGLGKPAGQDAARGRPNAVARLGVAGAMQLLHRLTEAAAASIPTCPGAAGLRALTRLEADRLVPKNLSRDAA